MAGHLVRVGQDYLSHRLYRCGVRLEFRHWLQHQKTTLHSAHFCQLHLLCPLCAVRRAGKLLRKYDEKAQRVAVEHDLWLVTLTVRNGPDLSERMSHLRGSLKKLRKRAAKGYGAFAPAAGAVWAYEVTNKAGEWHPHVHMVWAMPKGSSIRWGEGSQLRQDWHDITGDSFIVHAAPIKRGAEVDGLLEVLKYALKFGDLSLDDNVHAWRTLRRRHLIGSSGVWRGIEEPDDLADDPLDGPFIEIVFRWAGSQGYVPFDQQTWENVDRALTRTEVDSDHGFTGEHHGTNADGQTVPRPHVLHQGEPEPGHAREVA